MGIFDRFSKPKPPKGYCEVKAEFTEEESKAIRRALKRFPTIADADAPDGMEVVVPLKVKDGITAQGLAEYAVDLIHEVEGPASDGKLPLMDKAIKAVMKAYVIHNLPVYLFHVAEMFEFVGDTANAKTFFHQFLQAQSNFKPDRIDTLFLNQIGFDINVAIAKARERLG